MKRIFILAALLALPAMAHADFTSRVQSTWDITQFQVGIGNQWNAGRSEAFRDVEPDPFAFGRVQVPLPSRFGLEGEVGRRIDVGNRWNTRAALTFRLK